MAKTIYTPELSASICEQIATSTNSMKAICANLGLSIYTILCWLSESHPNYREDFAQDYARAKEMQADMLAERVLEVASTVRVGEKTKTDKDGNEEITTGDMVDRSRLEVDALKWTAAHLRPRKYGDKLDLTSNGDKLSTSVIILPAKDAQQ